MSNHFSEDCTTSLFLRSLHSGPSRCPACHITVFSRFASPWSRCLLPSLICIQKQHFALAQPMSSFPQRGDGSSLKLSCHPQQPFSLSTQPSPISLTWRSAIPVAYTTCSSHSFLYCFAYTSFLSFFLYPARHGTGKQADGRCLTCAFEMCVVSLSR